MTIKKTPLWAFFNTTLQQIHTSGQHRPGNGASQQPSFDALFGYCTNLTSSIPENLFTGVHSQPVDYMFRHLFYMCNNLTGIIPANLFAGVQGTMTPELFRASFGECRNLTGSIPEKLFAGISGAPTLHGFAWTFMGCRNLTGRIPENLFGNISGPMANGMFQQTFEYCPGLTGPSAKINGKYLYEIWPNAVTDYIGSCYNGTPGLSDYADIPAPWKERVY